MDNSTESTMSYDEIKIVINTCDSKVNGSVAAITAVVFGEFGILRLYDAHRLSELIGAGVGTFFTYSKWWGLTGAYVVLGLAGLLFGYRAIAYSELAARAGNRLGRVENTTIHCSTGNIFDDLVREMIDDGGRFVCLKKWAVRQSLWLRAFVILLYILPFVAVAFSL